MRIKPDLQLTIKDIITVTGAQNTLLSDAPISAFVTSSKEALPSDLFIALDGENRSGAEFISEAKSRGAYTLSSDSSADICVSDVKTAVLEIARLYKEKLPCLRHTVAICGSVGKTTTKNMLTDLSGNFFKAHATFGNYNNYLGVFHTVLTAKKDTELLICEVGMNHRGEISPISRAISPSVAAITNIGTAHIGNLGSRREIANAKLEICDGMEGGTLIIPCDEPLLTEGRNATTFSVEGDTADYSILRNENGSFDIITGSFSLKGVNLWECERHILSSLIISVAVLDTLGASGDDILRAISENHKSYTRGKYIKVGPYEIFDDAYSSSLEAAINDMRMLDARHRKKCCVLGDMLELGDKSRELHEKIGEAAVRYNFNKIFAFGKYAEYIRVGALLAGLSEDKIFVNTDLGKPEITAGQILNFCESCELIMVKASNAVHAERIYDFLS